MTDLKLYVFNDNQEEVLVDFAFDLTLVNGYYPDPDDSEVMNLISYGQIYTVEKTHQLMTILNSRFN